MPQKGKIKGMKNKRKAKVAKIREEKRLELQRIQMNRERRETAYLDEYRDYAENRRDNRSYGN